MGRKKLHRTKEELDEMNRIRRMDYYNKHKEEENEKSLNRYYNKKLKIQISNGDELYDP